MCIPSLHNYTEPVAKPIGVRCIMGVCYYFFCLSARVASGAKTAANAALYYGSDEISECAFTASERGFQQGSLTSSEYPVSETRRMSSLSS